MASTFSFNMEKLALGLHYAVYYLPTIYHFPSVFRHKMKAPPRTEQRSLEDDSMDTMDLYRLFEQQDGLEEQEGVKDGEVPQILPDGGQDRENAVSEGGYFATVQEESHVKAFLGE